jgi:hypothetical protein
MTTIDETTKLDPTAVSELREAFAVR